MRKLTLALAAASLLFTLNSAVVARASTPQPLWVGTNVAQLAEQAPIHWFRWRKLRTACWGGRRWPSALISMTPSSSPVRVSGAGKNLLSRQRGLPEKPAVLGKMNNGWDEFSMPKEVARQLIAMHVKRGDSIWFVTGRSQTKTETVSKTLQDDFSSRPPI